MILSFVTSGLVLAAATVEECVVIELLPSYFGAVTPPPPCKFFLDYELLKLLSNLDCEFDDLYCSLTNHKVYTSCSL